MVNSFGQFVGDVRVSEHISQGCAKALVVVYVCVCLNGGVGLCCWSPGFFGPAIPLTSLVVVLTLLLLPFQWIIQMDPER